jgi:cellulose synthase/poly-beta-1,6-N-acetylglucosamine synthase-like glycosyltransferase
MSQAAVPTHNPEKAAALSSSSTIPMVDLSLVSFNSERWIEPFFKSLLSQNHPCDRIRVLIRDNGSSDSTFHVIQSVIDLHGSSFACIHLDRGPNVGYGQAHNHNFFTHAQSEWFWVSNVDLEFEDNTLVNLLAQATNDDPKVASWECRQKPYEHPKHYHPATLETAWSSSACVLFRSQAFRSVKGYDPRIFMYTEDVDLSFRLRDHGWTLKYVPKSTVWHFTYEQSHQVKPLQFFGSTLGNVLLRCRYGRVREILQGFLMFASLLLMPSQFPGQRLGVLTHSFKLIWRIPYFLRTRKRSNLTFPFRMWDYEFTRDGAFYQLEPLVAKVLQPLVSILVRTTSSRGSRLREAVLSVTHQTYPRIDLVVVQDGGDNAQIVLNELRSKGLLNGLESVQFKPLPKMGRCLAGNEAMALSKGQFLCFLDDDDLLYADHVEVLVEKLLKDQTQVHKRPLAAVYGLGLEVQTEVVSLDPWVYRELRHDLVFRQPFSRALLMHHNFMPIQTVLFKRELFEKLGGFDPELDNLEDWNLWVRFALDHDFQMVEKVTSLYRVPAFTQEAVERQQVLDDHYSIACEKHRQLMFQTNPTEFVEMAKELADDLYVVSVDKKKLKSWLIRTPVLNAMYYFFVRCLNFFKKIKSKFAR